MNRIALLTLASLLAATQLAHSQTAPAPKTAPTSSTAPASTLTPEEITRLIQNLGDKDFPTREAADKKLRAAGWSALSDILIAKGDLHDAESRSRLTAMIEAVAWNTDGLSPHAATLADEMHAAMRTRKSPDSFFYMNVAYENDPEKLEAFWRLASAQVVTGVRLVDIRGDNSATPSPAWLRHVADLQQSGRWEQLEWETIGQGRAADLALILRNRPADADKLVLAFQAVSPPQNSAAARLQILSYLVQNFPIDSDRLLMLLQSFIEPPVPSNSPTNYLLMTLAKSGSRPESALQLARTLHVPHFEEQILAQRQDWVALSRFPIEHDFFNVSRFIPASALIFSGKIAEGEDIIAANSKAADGVEPVGLQRQVVLLGRIDLINQACIERGDGDTLVEFLLRERRYAKAMEFHSKPGKPREGKDAWPGGTISGGGVAALGPANVMDAQLDSRLLLALVKLNEWDRARAEIKRLDAAGANPYWLNQADALMGNADAILARAKQVKFDSRFNGRDIPQVFGTDASKLVPWADLIFSETKDASVTIDKLNLILHNQLPAEEIARLADLSNQPTPAGRPNINRYGAVLLPYAAIELEKLGRNDLAVRYLNLYFDAVSTMPHRSDSFALLQGIASQILALKNSKLPEQFLEACSKQKECDPAIQFIAGVFKSRAGDAPGGRQLLESAEHLIGGDTERRLFLAETLFELGEFELATSQASLMTQIEGPVSKRLMDAHELLARIAQQQGRFADALQNYRLAFYANFYDSISIPEDYEHFYQFPRNLAYCQSRVALQKNDRLHALQSALDVINLDPEGLDLTTELIRAFQQSNFKDQATSLANFNRNLLESILKDFPNSHFHHALIAQLDIDTSTVTDQTRQHLKTALQLSPNNPTYLALQKRLPTAP